MLSSIHRDARGYLPRISYSNAVAMSASMAHSVLGGPPTARLLQNLVTSSHAFSHHQGLHLFLQRLRGETISRLNSVTADFFLNSSEALAVRNDFNGGLDRLLTLCPAADGVKIRHAFTLGETLHMGQERNSGGPYIEHPVAVFLSIVDALENIDLPPSQTNIRFIERLAIGALLHDIVEDTKFPGDLISVYFGDDVGAIVDGLSKVEAVKRQDKQILTLQKLLISAGRYIEVLIIKLCDRLHNMKTLEPCREEHQKRVAVETLEVFVPLAEKLGMWQLREQLLELSIIYAEPEEYQRLQRAVEITKDSVLKHIEVLADRIRSILTEGLMEARVSLIDRTAGSLRYEERGKRCEDRFGSQWIPNLFEIRIVIDSLNGADRLPGPRRFDLMHAENIHRVLAHLSHAGIGPAGVLDFNWLGTRQKTNGYQAYHRSTTCRGQIVLLEVFDRAVETVNRFGVLANPANQSKWLQNFLSAWYSSTRVLDIDQLKTALSVPITVFSTEDSTIREFPSGATVLDFAYSIGSDTGDTVSTAEVNGKPAALVRILEDGNVVRIIRGFNSQPPIGLVGTVKTDAARNALRRHIDQLSPEDLMTIGKTAITRALKARNIYITPNEIANSTLSNKFLLRMSRVYKLISWEDSGQGMTWPQLYCAMAHDGLDPGLCVSEYLLHLRESRDDANVPRKSVAYRIMVIDRPLLLQDIATEAGRMGINISNVKMPEMMGIDDEDFIEMTLQTVCGAQRKHF